MSQSTPMFDSMEPMEALSIFSENQIQYEITWECGRGTASARQKVAGVGDVVENGYRRVVPHEYFANMARSDPDATVVELD